MFSLWCGAMWKEKELASVCIYSDVYPAHVLLPNKCNQIWKICARCVFTNYPVDRIRRDFLSIPMWLRVGYQPVLWREGSSEVANKWKCWVASNASTELDLVHLI